MDHQSYRSRVIYAAPAEPERAPPSKRVSQLIPVLRSSGDGRG
jgi:hypothetical protein